MKIYSIRKLFPSLLLAGFTISGAAFAIDNALSQLIDEAIRVHPLIESQQAMLEAAKSGVEGARWQFFPTPTVSIESAQATQGDPNYAGDKQVVLLGLRQPLWTGGRLSAGLDKAEANAKRSKASIFEVRQQLALRVIQGFGDWLAATERNKAYESGLALHRKLRELVVRRVNEGQSAPSDLTLAEGRLATLEADSLAAKTQELTALSRLSLLVNRSVNSNDLSIHPAKTISFKQGLSELLSQAEGNSPALARYRALAKIQKSVIDERKADLWPEVHARLEQQYGNYSLTGRGAETRFFVGVSTKFGAGLSAQSSIAEASNQYNAALSELEAQKRSLHEQIMADFTLYVQSTSRLQALNQANEMSKQVLQSWDRQFLSGRKTRQDLMNSAREQVQLEIQLQDLEVARFIASWRIKILTEMPSDATYLAESSL